MAVNNIDVKSKYPKILVFIIALIIAMLTTSLYRHGTLKKLESFSLDWRFRMNSAMPRPPSLSSFINGKKSGGKTIPEMVLIDLPDMGPASGGELRHDACSITTKILASAGARAILIASVLSTPQDGTQDPELADIIRASDVYLPVLYKIKPGAVIGDLYQGEGVEGVKRPLPIFTGKNVSIGHINAFPNAYGRLRRVPAVIRYSGEDAYQLGLRVAFDLAEPSHMVSLREENIKFDPKKHSITFSTPDGKGFNISLDENNQLIINWGSISEKGLKRFSYKDMVESYRMVLYGVRKRLLSLV